VAAASVTAAMLAAGPAGANADRPGHYVALGSSYAAGPGITPVADAGCARSGRNYPHQLAAALGSDLVDVTCSGATTADILSRSQRGFDGRTVPPQIDAVTAETDLVTVTIGGNDLGLVGGMLAGSCGPALAQAAPAVAAPATAACAAVTGGPKSPAPADYTALTHALTEIVGAIRERAPRAGILLVQYLPVLDQDADLCPAIALDPSAATTARHTYDGLLAATRAAAATTGVTAVDLPGADRHTACAADAWTDGFHRPTADDPARVISSYHPNLAGMTATADYLTRQSRR